MGTGAQEAPLMFVTRELDGTVLGNCQGKTYEGRSVQAVARAASEDFGRVRVLPGEPRERVAISELRAAYAAKEQLYAIRDKTFAMLSESGWSGRDIATFLDKISASMVGYVLQGLKDEQTAGVSKQDGARSGEGGVS